MSDEDLRGLLATAEEQADAARDEALRLTREWARYEAEAVEKFFQEEGRLTVVNQSAVTAKIRDRIPDAKERVHEIAAGARTSVEAWASSLTTEDGMRREDLQDGFNAAIKPAREEFGSLLEGLGYSPSNNSSRFASEWEFYNPKTGTARNSTVPMGYSAEVKEALSVYGSLKSRAIDLRRRIDEREAQELWDE